MAFEFFIAAYEAGRREESSGEAQHTIRTPVLPLRSKEYAV